MKLKIAAFAALTALAIAPLASAEDEFELEFQFSPAEVSTQQGAAEIYSELESKIKEECEPRSTREKIFMRAQTAACVESTLEAAVKEIDSPALTEIHNLG